MSSRKVWLPLALCVTLLSACSPIESVGRSIIERSIHVKRYPDQQQPYVGYISGGSGYIWKKNEKTRPRTAWSNVQETESTGDADEVSLEGNRSFTVEQKPIVGKSLEAIIQEGAAYDYKHHVPSVRIDSQFTDGERTIASFPYVYKGRKYMGTVIATNKGQSYVYGSLDFSPDLNDEGKEVPFVPGNGSMGFGENSSGEKRAGIEWMGGTINDERIHTIVVHFKDGGERQIPIDKEQATYLVPAQLNQDFQYIEGLDEQGKAVYTWQY
ncbi:hypothetical protein B9G55_09655 [Saccharibacillus sp. O16]|nr:hypothetical protein B9G55_09655 [Saccharibacillus sp. O16]